MDVDRLHASILIHEARLALISSIEQSVRLRRAASVEREAVMPGKIREALAGFKRAHAQLEDAVVKEITAATGDVHQARSEGVQAVQLARAFTASARAEIQEIRDEFAESTNGDPNPGPLPGSETQSSASGDGASKDARPQQTQGNLAAGAAPEAAQPAAKLDEPFESWARDSIDKAQT